MVFWNIGVDKPIAPTEAMPPMPAIPAGDVLIIGGRAPTWRFGMALHAAHGSAAAVVAFFDPRLGGGVVVASHKPGISEGQILPCEWQD